MPSVVEICNLALAHLGDDATVASIDPPEGSAQAEHCARFYPSARDMLLQMHTWSFASRRVSLAQVTMPYTMWKYSYACPGDMMTAVAVLPPDAENDYSVRAYPADRYGFGWTNPPITTAGVYVPQEYVIETDTLGNKVIYTNQENALLRYQALVSDSTKFDPLFTIALSWQLASFLAGPVVKGEEGARQGQRCLQMVAIYLGQARMSDANQRDVKPGHITSWISGR
ncbi:MAG: hypothetical protein ACOYMI_11035 [Phycisphaerales bacterium]|jgi:hypothetical protein